MLLGLRRYGEAQRHFPAAERPLEVLRRWVVRSTSGARPTGRACCASCSTSIRRRRARSRTGSTATRGACTRRLPAARIDALSKPGETVVDPFCGSGTVLVEAMAAGRRGDRRRRQRAGGGHRPRALDVARRGRIASGWWPRRRASPRSPPNGPASGAAPRFPPGRTRRLQRFHAHVLFELLGLRELVFATKERSGRAGAAALPVVDPGQVHEGGPRGAARRRGEADCARHPVADAGRSRGRAGPWSRLAGAADAAPGRRRPRCTRRTRARCRSADRERGAGALVAALRRDLRLRRAARDALRLAGAVGAEVPEGPAGRAGLGHR